MIKIDKDLIQSDAFSNLLEKGESLTFKKGDLIVQSGKICNYLFLVESGLLRNFYYDIKGNDITHWFAKEEMLMTIPPSFFYHEESVFNIEAIENTQVRAFSHNNLEDALLHSRIIERFGRELITQIMIALGKKVIDMQTKRASERYKDFAKSQPDIFRRANLGHIASYLGITQQSLSRVRSCIK